MGREIDRHGVSLVVCGERDGWREGRNDRMYYELVVLLLLSLVEDRVRADVEKCRLSGLEFVSLFIKCRLRRRSVRLTLRTTKPSMSITLKREERIGKKERGNKIICGLKQRKDIWK